MSHRRPIRLTVPGAIPAPLGLGRKIRPLGGRRLTVASSTRPERGALRSQVNHQPLLLRWCVSCVAARHASDGRETEMRGLHRCAPVPASSIQAAVTSPSTCSKRAALIFAFDCVTRERRRAERGPINAPDSVRFRTEADAPFAGGGR